MRSVFIIILVLFFSSELLSDNLLEISGQIRHRYEMDNRDFNNDTEFNNYNLLRSRLSVKLSPVENLSGFFQIQDSRFFGEEENTLDGSANNLDLHQAYFVISNLFKLPLDLKIGRFEVLYANERLFGPVGWNNIGRSFDGVLLKYHIEKLWIDLFNFKETEQMDKDNEGDKNVMGIYSDFKISEKYITQFFVITDRINPSEKLNRFTAGFYANGKLGNFSHETEFAYQFGTIDDKDVKAMMACLNLNYKLNHIKIKPGILLGIDYLTGDDPETDEIEIFNTLYSTNHKFYGYMDYFTNIPLHTYGSGLSDIHFGLFLKPVEKMICDLKFHIFNANQDYTLNNGKSAKDFGNEIDFTLKYDYNEKVNFTGGYSVFLPGEIFKEKFGEDNSNWLYLMTTVNF